MLVGAHGGPAFPIGDSAPGTPPTIASQSAQARAAVPAKSVGSRSRQGAA